jgi:UDP-2-acetamido-2-deoxy-ribo-hexuluronate aminotransferase
MAEGSILRDRTLSVPPTAKNVATLTLNVVLAYDVALDLLREPKPRSDGLSAARERMRELGARLWLPVCLAPALQQALSRDALANAAAAVPREQSVTKRLRELAAGCQPLSSLGQHLADLPPDHPSPADALVSLAAAELPGRTIIWTEERCFKGITAAVASAGHQAIFELFRPEVTKGSFVDLGAQQLRMRAEIEARIFAVLRHGRYILGPEVAELEQQLADFVGVHHGVAVSSGTDALLMALMALGVKRGDEVITSCFSFIATAETIALLGAVPVFVDIDSATYNLRPELVEEAITARTRAIVPVSLYGQCADLDAVNAIAERHGLVVLEDAAQSFGATYRGRRSGGLSSIGATSFFPTKPLGCYGDGGACLTNGEQLASCLRQIREHGHVRRYHHPILGLNGRLDTLQAAILLTKLKHLPKEIERRRWAAGQYDERLRGRVAIPEIASDCTSVYAQYTVQVDHRRRVLGRLHQDGVPAAVHYPLPLHRQEAFSGLTHSSARCPVAERVAKRVLSLPMHADLTEADLDRYAQALIRALDD